MLYLIKSGNYLKIGYTNNLDERRKCYETHNPSFEILDVAEGDVNDEKSATYKI